MDSTHGMCCKGIRLFCIDLVKSSKVQETDLITVLEKEMFKRHNVTNQV